MNETPERAQQWDRWFKVASVATTGVVLPGIAWALRMSHDMHNVQTQVQMLAQQMDTDRRGLTVLCDEIKSLRTSVETLRSDVLQRLTRVETRIDSNVPK
jgi:hypothetical protein